jgi:hypothetical protein
MIEPPGHLFAVRAAADPLDHGWRVPRELGLVTRGRDRREPGTVRRAQPQAAPAQVQPAPQRADDAVQGLFGREAGLQHRRDLGNHPDTGMFGIERGSDHRSLR